MNACARVLKGWRAQRIEHYKEPIFCWWDVNRWWPVHPNVWSKITACLINPIACRPCCCYQTTGINMYSLQTTKPSWVVYQKTSIAYSNARSAVCCIKHLSNSRGWVFTVMTVNFLHSWILIFSEHLLSRKTCVVRNRDKLPSIQHRWKRHAWRYNVMLDHMHVREERIPFAYQSLQSISRRPLLEGAPYLKTDLASKVHWY